MPRTSQTCMEVIACRTFVIMIDCCTILTFGRGQTLVSVWCTWHVYVRFRRFQLIAPWFAVRKLWRWKRICRSIRSVLIGSCYLNMVCCLSSCVVAVVTCIPPGTSMNGLVKSALTLVGFIMLGKLDGCRNAELLAISPSHRPSHSIKTPGSWRELERFRLLGVPTPPVFGYYSSYILKYFPRQNFFGAFRHWSSWYAHSFRSFIGLGWHQCVSFWW